MEKTNKDIDDINFLIDTDDTVIYQQLLEDYKSIPDLICQVRKEIEACEKIDLSLYASWLSEDTLNQLSKHTEGRIKFWKEKLEEWEKKEEWEIINEEEWEIIDKNTNSQNQTKYSI